MMANNNYNSQKCCALMQKLAEASFFALDLNLYLDTHPCDTAAIELFEEASKNADEAREDFERCCYPLKASSAGCQDGEWDWLMGAWPSERI